MSIWFPSENLISDIPFVGTYDIGEAEQVAKHYPAGHEDRLQLSAGKFNGRIFRCDLDDVQIKTEQNSHRIESESLSNANYYGFAVIVHQDEPFVGFGLKRSYDSVIITPPNAVSHAILPANGLAAFLYIKTESLFSHSSLSHEAADWLASLKKVTTCIQSPWLANRLREDYQKLLECTSSRHSVGYKNALKSIAVTSIVTAFSMEFSRRRNRSVLQKSRSYEMFQKMRSAILSNPDADHKDLTSLFPDVSIARRTIENIFSQNAGLAPRKYYQVYRLGKTRRKLLDQKTAGKNIGDLAAEEGFWEWSRFSQYYRKHFDERPSETRARIRPSER